MPTSVLVPGRLTGEVILDFPDAATAWYELDARGLEFVEPAGLVQLALLLRWLVARAPRVRFLAPSNGDVDAYLARMDFYQHVPSAVERVDAIDPATLGRAERGDVLLPLQHFRTVTEAEELNDSVYQYLQRQNLPAGLVPALWSIVSELSGNAASHGGSQYGAFLAAQSYQGSKRYIAVGDLGVGIRKHLGRNPAYASLTSDEAAIREAIKPGVSGTAEHRGYGFEVIQDSAADTGRARLLIRSGNGWGRISIVDSGRRRTFGTVQSNFPGTLVQLSHTHR